MGRSQKFTQVATAYDTGGALGMRNRIINGDMRIDQRNAGAAVAPTSSAAVYPVDRWRVASTLSSRVNSQRNLNSLTPPAGFSNYLGLVSTGSGALGASDAIVIEQVIEGFNVADLAYGTASAASLTLSFWARSSLTGTMGASLATTPTISGSASVRSYPFTYTINAANTWELKTVVIPGDTLAAVYETGSGTGLFVRFIYGAGSGMTGTANTWQTANARCPSGCVDVSATNGANLYITGVQIEAGTVATPFDRRPYGLELLLCQRYLPAFKSSGAVDMVGNGMVVSSTQATALFNFYVPPRAAPTGITLSAASHFTINLASGGATASALSLTGAGDRTARLLATISGGTAGQACELYANTTSGQILFTGCEL